MRRQQWIHLQVSQRQHATMETWSTFFGRRPHRCRRTGLQQSSAWTMRWCRMTALIRSWKNWTDVGRSRKTKIKRRRSKRPSSRRRGTSKWKRPSCHTWHGGSLIFNNWKMHWGRHYQQWSRVTRHCETRNLLKAATTTTTSCEHWCGWIALRCDKRQVRTDIFHWPGSGCTDNRCRFRDLDTTKYALERDSRRTARGRRFRTRWSDRHPGRRWSGGNWREWGTGDIIAGSTRFPALWVPGCPRGSQCCAEVSRFLRPQTRCKWQRSGAAHEALEHSTAETAHEMCKMSQTWTLGSRVSRRESRTTQRWKVRPTWGETWGKLKRVHHCSKAYGTKTFLSRRFLDIRHSWPWRSPVGHLVPKNTVSKSNGVRRS